MGLKLIGEVALDGSGFERGLNSMASSVKGFIAGAFGLYGVETMIRKTVDTAKELVTESKRLGIGVEQLQVLKQAAKDNSTELETLARAFEKIDIARGKALSGSKEGQGLLARFGQLGISLADLQSKSASDLFMGPMRDRANSMSQEDLGPILKDVLGKGFGEVIPVLKTDFEELRGKMEKMGALLSAETVVKLKALDDQFSLLSRIIVSQLGPALVKLAEFAYSWALKGGKSAAGAAAELGAGTAKMGVMESIWATAKLAGYGANALGARALGASEAETTAWLKSKAAAAGFDVPSMQGAKVAAEAPWAKAQKEFADLLAKLADQAKELNNPLKPKFGASAPEDDTKEKREKSFHESGDALLKVGNFLGSSRSTLEDIAQKQVNLLQQIADNTRSSGSGWSAFNPSDDNFPMS